MTSSRMLLIFLWLLTSCGAHTTSRWTLEQLRSRAASLPRDAEAQLELAEGELLLPGGNPLEAFGPATRAVELAPDHPRAALLLAVERELHGDAPAALVAMVNAVKYAAHSTDPWAHAIAETATASLIDMIDAVPGYRDLITSELLPVYFEHPTNLGPAARHNLGRILSTLSLMGGDVAHARNVALDAGCALSLNVAGPFGDRGPLDFDRAFTPETEAALAAAYNLGPRRGEGTVRTLTGHSCGASIGGGPIAEAGVWYVETTVSVGETNRYLLRTETPNSYQIWIDGNPLTRLDRRTDSSARIHYDPVDLDSGEHRIRVKMYSRHPSPYIALSLTHLNGSPAGRPAPLGQEMGNDDFSSSDRPLAGYLTVARELSRANYVGVRHQLAGTFDDESASPVLLILGAAATLSDPLLDGSVGRDRARALLRNAFERDSQAWYPILQQTRLEAEAGRINEAVRSLAEVATSFPHVFVVQAFLLEMYRNLGWNAQADLAIDAIRTHFPDSCQAIQLDVENLLSRNRFAEVQARIQALVECNAQNNSALSQFIRERRWADAQRELERLATLEPESNQNAVLDVQLTLARAMGNQAEVRRLAAQLRERVPYSEAALAILVDAQYQAGREEPARGLIQTTIDTQPSLAGLRRSLRALGGNFPLERYRQNGLAIIADFETHRDRYEAPSVLVLDYTVTQVFENGSIVDLTHQIFRVQTEEAADDVGQFSLPPGGGHLLTLRTVKADGSILEPDDISELSHIELPNLQPGDYVEYEYYRYRNPAPGFPNGVLGDRFYFQSYETPFDRSELTLIVPASVTPIIEARGPAPETETTVTPTQRTFHWIARQSEPVVQEPGSVSSREFLASVGWGYQASWTDLVLALSSSLADRDVIDPTLIPMVSNIAGTGDVRSRVSRVYRWVMDEIEAQDDLFGNAAPMVHRRTGQPLRVLRYLLRLIDIDSQLLITKSIGTPEEDPSLPDQETYDQLVLRVLTPEPLYLSTSIAHGAFGLLPPGVQGQGAVVLRNYVDGEALERVRLPALDLANEVRSISADVTLSADGSGTLSITETFHGVGAAFWRSQLRAVPEAELEERFGEAYVARLIPGGRTLEVHFEGIEDPEAPIVLRYRVESRLVARRAGSELRIPALFATGLSSAMASLETRRFAQLINAPVAVDVVLHFSGPQFTAPESTPEVDGPSGAEWRETRSISGGTLTVTRSLRIPPMRVEPQDYPQLAEFCRRVDSLEQREILSRP